MNQDTQILAKEDFEALRTFVNTYYEGNLLLLSKWLDRAIYILHFVPNEENITPLQRQNTCDAIMGLKESLMHEHFSKEGIDFNPFL